MGYRIVYGEDPFAGRKKEKSHLRIMTAGFALAFLILVRCFWPQGTSLLCRTLLPGNGEALQQLTAQIRAGEPIADAVTTFCRGIVEEAVGQTD